MSKLEQLFRNIQQDLKLYLFILGVFCLFRIGFIVILQSYISEATTTKDILRTLYYGVRISLKSAGIIAFISFWFCTVLNIVYNHKKIKSIRWVLGYLYIGILSVLFYARIPYYEQFHTAFNQFIFVTFKDDVEALFFTLIQQYNLPLRLGMALVTAFLLSRLLHKWLHTKTYSLPRFSKRYQNIAFRVAIVVAVWYFTLFIRFGGSLTYAYDISWENSAVTKDEFLNEAILDDVQALYRAYTLNERLSESTGLNIDEAKISEYGEQVAGRPVAAKHVDDFFKKEAQGAKIPKPKHIFLIVAESYANWPLLPQYKDVNIANGLKNIIEKNDAIYVPTFLPNGMSTIGGVNGIVTGLTEVNLYVNYQPESYKEAYATAIAPQMKKLGYKTRFWYCGPSSWERVKDISLAQGFNEFYAYGDFPSQAGNVWGSDDKYLLNAVSAALDETQPTFNIILTVSNHAPYTVDLQQEGFDENSVIRGLPDKLKSDEELIKKLGHFWYSDKVISEFIQNTRTQYPDSLFMVVGDHADRLNLDTTPTLYERYAIPFVVYGKGITKNIFPEKVAGSHINVTPTLIELIAPKGFEYYSAGESLTRGNNFGMNYGFWITGDSIGKIGQDAAEVLPLPNTVLRKPTEEQLQRDIDAVRAVSWWRIKYGKELNPNQLNVTN